ncbi:hypothetical protein BSPCLSOX_1646, partial [uncultured Gammaproteobacteria bacterium]
GMAPSDIDSLQQKADELDQQLEKLTDKMEEIITAQSQALDNIEPQTQAANATNAKVIKIKKEVEQAQDNLIQAQQSVATLEKKIQANNQAIEQETQAEETAKQAIQKEQEKQAKTSNEIKQRQAENEAAIKEKIETEKSLKKLQNTQRSHKPAKKATKEEDQIAKNILAAKVNEARKLDGEKKRIVKATADALTTANQQLQETEKTIETANKTLTQAQQSIQQQTTNRQQTQQEQSSANQLLEEATQTVAQLKTQEATATTENKIAQDTLRTAQKEQGIEDREEEIRNIRQQLDETSNNMSKTGTQIRQHEHNAAYEEKAKEAEADNIVNYEEDTLKQNAPIKTRLVRNFLSYLAGVKVSYSGSHTTVHYEDPATGTTTTIKSGPLSGAAHEHILIDNVLKIAKALNLSKSTLKNKFGVTVLSSPKKPETPLDTIPTPNKEIVVVQMGDNQEVIATRKRMVE